MHYRAGERAAAARCCHAALDEQPDNFDALHLLGVLETDDSHPVAAIDWLRRAIAVRPDVAQAHYHLGNALLAADRHQDAVDSFAQALALQPDHADAHNNQGNALRTLGRYEEATACYRRALVLRPNFAAAHYNLGRTLSAQNRPEEAVESLRTALQGEVQTRDDHHLADVYGELGRALLALDRVEEALETCRALNARLPNEPSAVWNESLALLLLGRYREAWPKYERRFEVVGHDAARVGHHVPDLATVAGKRVLVAAEQGRGDLIQFTRYAPLLARRGAEVVIEAYPDLVSLFRTLDGVADVVEFETNTPHDLLVSLLTLPMAFGTEVDSIPADVPYLHATPERLATWRARLGLRVRPRVGVAWWGSPTSRPSSIPVAELAPLLHQPGVDFHVLHKEVPDDQRAWLNAHSDAVLHTEALADFADTAALIAEMDLVITVDTSVAHLAGALGKPVWIMLSSNPDWRWLRNRTDSPWYPTARLFRRGTREDWTDVVAAVGRALPEALIASPV